MSDEVKVTEFARETERVPPSDARSQGDIIRIEHVPALDEPDLGVIINADCDLAHGRLDGVLTYLPLYTFKEYLARFWAPTYVADVAGRSTRNILEMAGDGPGEAEGLHRWIKDDGHAVVAAAIARQAGLKKGPAVQLGQEAAKLAIALDDDLEHYKRFGDLCGTESDPAGHARKQILAAKKAMGDGHFFISDLVDHSELGFVVRMRRVLSIPEDRCFRSLAEQRSASAGSETTAVRVGRLTPLYRIKVLQLFAQQFTRIGLDDDVTALSAMAVEDLVATLVGGEA